METSLARAGLWDEMKDQLHQLGTTRAVIEDARDPRTKDYVSGHIG